MSTISGVATSYDLPQYVGELLTGNKSPRSFLRLIGARTAEPEDTDGTDRLTVRAPRRISSDIFSLGVQVDETTESQPSHTEGGAPSFTEVDSAAESNVVQIFHEGFGLTWSAQSNDEALDELISGDGHALVPGGGQGDKQYMAALARQRTLALRRVERQMNFTMLKGSYARGSSGVARQARGLRTALSTNVNDNAGTPRALSKTLIEETQKSVVDNGGMEPGDRLVLLAGSDQFDAVGTMIENDFSGDEPRSRSEKGVMVRRVWTHYGPVDIAYEADVDAGEVILFQPDKCRPVAREITMNGQRAGIFFAYKLATDGSQDKFGLYGEWSVDYTREWYHAAITDLS